MTTNFWHQEHEPNHDGYDFHDLKLLSNAEFHKLDNSSPWYLLLQWNLNSNIFQSLDDNNKLVHGSTQLIERLVDVISLFHDSTFVFGGF